MREKKSRYPIGTAGYSPAEGSYIDRYEQQLIPLRASDSSNTNSRQIGISSARIGRK